MIVAPRLQRYKRTFWKWQRSHSTTFSPKTRKMTSWWQWGKKEGITHLQKSQTTIQGLWRYWEGLPTCWERVSLVKHIRIWVALRGGEISDFWLRREARGAWDDIHLQRNPWNGYRSTPPAGSEKNAAGRQRHHLWLSLGPGAAVPGDVWQFWGAQDQSW